MAKFSVVFLLALFAAPLNVVAQGTGNAPIIFTGPASAAGPAVASNMAAGGGAAAGGAGATTTGTGTGANAAATTGTNSGTESGSAAASGSGGSETVFTTLVTGVTTETQTIAATTVSGSVISAQTLTSTRPFTAEETVTQGGAAASSTSKGFAGHNANVDVGFVAGLVLFLAAGL